MAMEFLTMGSSPAEETCAQVGADNYDEQSIKECRAYLNQLGRQFGEPPAAGRFAIKSFPHDFGSYREVVVYYKFGDEESTIFAFKVDGDVPARWDADAMIELGLPSE